MSDLDVIKFIYFQGFHRGVFFWISTDRPTYDDRSNRQSNRQQNGGKIGCEQAVRLAGVQRSDRQRSGGVTSVTSSNLSVTFIFTKSFGFWWFYHSTPPLLGRLEFLYLIYINFQFEYCVRRTSWLSNVFLAYLVLFVNFHPSSSL